MTGNLPYKAFAMSFLGTTMVLGLSAQGWQNSAQPVASATGANPKWDYFEPSKPVGPTTFDREGLRISPAAWKAMSAATRRDLADMAPLGHEQGRS